MKVILLSAGQGRRLLPLTKSVPKCALDIAARTLLEWQIHEIAQCEVDEIVVVTGFGGDIVDEIVKRNQDLRVKVRALYNPFFAISDNLATCWVAGREMTEPFVIINGDTLFEAAILRKLLASPADAPITLVTDHKGDYDDDDMKVVVQGERLRRVGKQLSEGVNGESIGMMIFRGDGPQHFLEKIEHIMRYGEGANRWYLSAIDELAQSSQVNVCSVEERSWCEVDDQADLEVAKTTVIGWYAGVEQSVAGRV